VYSTSRPPAKRGSRAIAVRARDSAWRSGEFRRPGPSLVKVETSDQQWLSMDYQVFVLSRITERYDQTRDTTDAVTFGVSSTARITGRSAASGGWRRRGVRCPGSAYAGGAAWCRR
jgi:hypothetical protein